MTLDTGYTSSDPVGQREIQSLNDSLSWDSCSQDVINGLFYFHLWMRIPPWIISKGNLLSCKEFTHPDQPNVKMNFPSII